MLWRYQRGSGERAGPAPAVLAALAGIAYSLVWTAFGLAAYAVGTLSAAAKMSWTAVARSVPIATGIALLLAGIVQLTEWKARQLDRCRDATRCGVDARNVWSHSLRHGMRCSLCCAGLMIVLLAAGVMNLGAMVAVAGAITIERIAPHPRRAARASGLVALGAGALTIVRALAAV